MPGRATMCFAERENGRWRVVAALPDDVLARAEPPAVPAFADVAAPADDVGMREWLALLERQVVEVKAGLLGLVRDYDAERMFSADTFDMDYDADLAASADVALPVLVALEDAVDAVRRCVERPRGAARMAIAADALVSEAVAAFAEVWPGLTLEVFEPSDDFYRAGLPDRRDPGLPLTVSTVAPSAAVELVGTMREKDVRDAIFAAFGAEAQVGSLGSGESLDEGAVRLG